MKGSYAHVGADGLPYMIDWFADDEGVHPSAPHPSKYVELVSDHAGEVVDTNINTSEAESEDMLIDEIFPAFPAMIFYLMVIKSRILNCRMDIVWKL